MSKIVCVPNGMLSLNWTAEKCGWGQLHFYEKNCRTYCDNEIMSKKFIKAALCQMVDDCILTEPSRLDSGEFEDTENTLDFDQTV